MPARIESIKVRNFRVLHDFEMRRLTPLTVLLGPNGSGKSTVLDVFSFLSECFQEGLGNAWAARGKAKELKTRNSNGPIMIEIRYREGREEPLVTYHLEVDEGTRGPFIVREWLAWRRGRNGKPFRLIDRERGRGEIVTGAHPEAGGTPKAITLRSAGALVANASGQFSDSPRLAALRNLLSGWRISHLSAGSAREHRKGGPQPHLSRSGGNLANVIQYLHESHPQRLEKIFDKLRKFVPRIESVAVVPLTGGQLGLGFKDTPFGTSVPPEFASEGTIKLLSYLVLLRDPAPPPLIGIEEPENSLHPRLLHELGELFQRNTLASQTLVATHSPHFIDALEPEVAQVLWRARDGHAKAERPVELRTVRDLIRGGAHLGDLWMEGFFEVGNPLASSGEPEGLPTHRA